MINKMSPWLPLRKLRRLLFYSIFLCFISTCLYFTSHNSLTFSGYLWNRKFISKENVYSLMKKDPFINSVITNPLHDLAQEGYWQLNYYGLPKRQVGQQFTEITSANRDTSYLLAPDFTFHLDYHDRSVTLYEDFGPGCMFRNYLYPHMPTRSDLLYKITPHDLKDTYLHYDIDDVEYQYSITDMMLGYGWPFMQPLNTQHPTPKSGIGAYIPICYQNHAKVTYRLSEDLPKDLFEKTINCSRNDITCPVKIYSSISRLKYAPGSRVSAFSAMSAGKDSHAASVLKHTELSYTPAEPCVLTCVNLCKDCHKLIHINKAAVIYAMNFRVFYKNKLSPDWTDILLSITWDNAAKPRIDKVPLGSFMGFTGSLNNFKGAAAGKLAYKCEYNSKDANNLPEKCVTGYIYFPMPFWDNAVIELKNKDKDVTICYQILTKPNQYPKQTTGYFSAHKTYYETNAEGYRTLLDLEGQWGHMVGVYMEIDNLVAKRNVPVSERWALLQADPVMFIDGTQSATVLGTGLEDYFSYAHGFNSAENTTYSFIGVHHGVSIAKGPQTWHCYRFHVLDPVPFQKSIRFIMEGIRDNRFKDDKLLTYEDYVFNKKARIPVISHLVLYYAQLQTGMRATDSIQIGNVKSEQVHNFNVLTKPGQSECRSIKPFSVHRKRYLGATTVNSVTDKFGTVFSKLCSFQFKLKISSDNSGAILRREFHSRIKVWNEKAEVFVDNVSQGVWFLPFGVLSEEYSLREEDFLLNLDNIRNKQEITVGIRTLTEWRDISYTIFVIER